jgi:hypothetical protein
MLLPAVPTSGIHQNGLATIVHHVGVLLKGVEGEGGDVQHERKSLKFAERKPTDRLRK